jgi:PAS domain S-box-containing protein
VGVTPKKEHEEDEQQALLWFLGSLDRVNRAIQGAMDLDAMLRDVLDAVLDVLDCDRAWLVHPGDPQAATWKAVVERTRPEFPGAYRDGEPPTREDFIELYRAVTESDVPLTFGAGSGRPLPEDVVAQFGIQSQMCSAVVPKVDRPYMFGVHQCSHPRVWSAADQRLFQEISRRVGDALTTLLVYQRMKQSESRFRVLVDHATDAFFLHAADGTILDVNRQACASLGYTREELVGAIPAAFDVDIDGAAMERFDERLAAGELISFDTKHRRKDGTMFPVEIRVRPFWEGGKRFAVALVRDITERQQLEEQFRQAQKMEAIGRLAGGVAHDFNNLLTIINCSCEMLAGGLGDDDPNGELVADIQNAGERAANLTRQLLAFSRKQILVPQIVSLNAVLGELLKFLRRLIGEDVELVLEAEPELGLARVDLTQFEQAIVNLAVNARDAILDGGRIAIATKNVELAPGLHPDIRPGPFVLVSVTDTGHGMDEATKARVFEPFFTTKEQGKGTGLGLAMVYGFVKQSNGHVDVVSEVGRGTTFRVYLPRSDTQSPTIRAAQSETSIPTGTETVLLVEDDDAVRGLSRTILESCGYTVLEASDGEQGLAVACRAAEIDLLVTDLVMPRMGGRRLAELLLAIRPKLRVLFMSGYSEEAAQPHGVMDAEVAFLHKPFTVCSLARQVRDTLDHRPT